MNWFTRIFSRRAASDEFETEFPAVDVVRYRSSAPVADPNRPGFSASATGLSRLTDTGGTNQQYRRAFTPSQPVSGLTRFAGRAQLLRRIIRAIEDQQLHVVLYGDRGMGKTSLLRVLEELARAANFIVHYTSCGEDTDFNTSFRAIAADIPLRYYAAGGQDRDEEYQAHGTLADRLPDGNFTVSQLSDVLARVSGTRVLLIFDEFDRANSPRFRASIAELIKNLSDRAIKVQILIAGVASNLTELIEHIPSIRRNIIGVPVPPMTAEEIADMVEISTRSGGFPFEPAAIERLAHLSAGLPYLASLLGQHAMLATAESGADRVGPQHMDIARTRAAEDIFSRLAPLTQYLLRQPEVFAPGQPIGDAAHGAIANEGQIIDAAVIERIKALPDDLAGLVEPLEGHPLNAWHFTEDSAPAYIWLMRAT